MNVIITADWHLTDNPRDAYRWDFVENVLPELLEEQRATALFFLGDVTEAKSGHSAYLVNRIVKAFKRLIHLCPVVCLQGNHDFLSVDQPFFGFLPEISDDENHFPLKWVNTVSCLRDPGFPHNHEACAVKTVFLPFTHNPDKDWANVDFRNYKWAFAHQCFIGAESESGFQLRGVPLSHFHEGMEIIAGDIHKPQTVGQLTYVGSPYSVDFGDNIEGRVLAWDGKTVKSIPLQGPQKRLIDVGSIQTLSKCKVNKGDIVKVRLDVDSYDQWPEEKARVEAWAKARGVALHLAQPVLKSATGKSVKALKVRESMTDKELLEAYAKNRQVEEPYVQAGLRLL